MTKKQKKNSNDQLTCIPTFTDRYIREVHVNYASTTEPVFLIANPVSVANFVRSVLTDNSREHFVALFLNTSNFVASYSIVSIGTANSAPVEPREVFQRAVLVGAISIVIAHNHPSGSLKPSDADIHITNRLCEAGQTLGIQVLDHLIIADHSFYSFKEDGRM
jgi:DNA repair protein RadC